jgi:hypothetical protein
MCSGLDIVFHGPDNVLGSGPSGKGSVELAGKNIDLTELEDSYDKDLDKDSLKDDQNDGMNMGLPPAPMGGMPPPMPGLPTV